MSHCPSLALWSGATKAVTAVTVTPGTEQFDCNSLLPLVLCCPLNARFAQRGDAVRLKLNLKKERFMVTFMMKISEMSCSESLTIDVVRATAKENDPNTTII